MFQLEFRTGAKELESLSRLGHNKFLCKVARERSRNDACGNLISVGVNEISVSQGCELRKGKARSRNRRRMSANTEALRAQASIHFYSALPPQPSYRLSESSLLPWRKIPAPIYITPVCFSLALIVSESSAAHCLRVSCTHERGTIRRFPHAT